MSGQWLETDSPIWSRPSARNCARCMKAPTPCGGWFLTLGSSNKQTLPQPGIVQLHAQSGIIHRCKIGFPGYLRVESDEFVAFGRQPYGIGVSTLKIYSPMNSPAAPEEVRGPRGSQAMRSASPGLWLLPHCLSCLPASFAKGRGG